MPAHDARLQHNSAMLPDFFSSLNSLMDHEGSHGSAHALVLRGKSQLLEVTRDGFLAI